MARGRWWPVALAATAVAAVAAYVIFRGSGRRDADERQPPTPRTRAAPQPRGAVESNRRKKIATVGANNVIISAAATGAFVPIKDAIDRLLLLATMFDVYIIAQCDSDEAEAQIADALEREGVFKADVDRRKLLFCSSAVGKAHMARQLEPQVHIDADAQSVSMLQPHVPSVIHVTTEGASSRVPANTQVAPSLAAADLSRL